MHELRRLAALREADRAQTAGDERRVEARGLAESARPDAELRVDERWVPERDRPLGARRRVLVDDRRLDAEQRVGQLAWVRDRRRREQETRVGAVDARQTAQPAKDVRDVRPEDAAVDMRLVDDDVAQVREDVAPAVVVREHAHVEHVRIRQDEVGPAPDLPAPLRLGVAVVDRRAHARNAQRGEAARLVLRERLRRIEVQRTRLRLARERVEHGQVERERLAARRAGGDHHVLLASRGVPHRPLVGVDPLDSLRRERLGDARVELVGERREARVVRGLRREVRELLALEQASPGCDDGCHPAIEAGTVARVRLPGCPVRG